MLPSCSQATCLSEVWSQNWYVALCRYVHLPNVLTEEELVREIDPVRRPSEPQCLLASQQNLHAIARGRARVCLLAATHR